MYRDPAAERTYLAWLDYLPTRTDVDGKRVAVWGGSFGAYWAARLAFTAADRIKGAVFHGGNVHYGFQREWLVPAFTTGGATYLFGAAEPARRSRTGHGREDDRGIPGGCARAVAQDHGPARQEVGAAAWASTASSTTRRRSPTSIC